MLPNFAGYWHEIALLARTLRHGSIMPRNESRRDACGKDNYPLRMFLTFIK